MNISEIRRQNTLSIIETRFGGTKARFARAIDISPVNVSQWCSKTKNVGNNSARKIENILGLPADWMDTSHAHYVPDHSSIAFHPIPAPFRNTLEYPGTPHPEHWNTACALRSSHSGTPHIR